MTWIAGGSDDLAVLVNFGANFGPLVAAGDLWRLVASIFLHAGVLHLVFNGYALYVLGRNLEAFYGAWTLLALFVLSGTGGSVASALLSDAISVGASGGIFGLLGASLVFAFRHRGVLPARITRIMGTALLPWVVLNIVLGVVVPRIDMAAHLGGLASGALLAWFVRPIALEEAAGFAPVPSRTLTSMTLALLVVSMASAGTNIMRMRGEDGPLLDPRIIAVLSELDRAEALRAIEETMAENPDDPSLRLARAMVRSMSDDWEGAIADYRAVLKVDPGEHRALNNLAWILLEDAPESLRSRREATDLARRAVEAAPDDPYSLGTYGTALLREGRPGE
ncbi:MAG TPA: rhomboid family intramembrane serine protease, partial [bacterium]|nr:rhomboid family intramembrane serine protease [bacterium]